MLTKSSESDILNRLSRETVKESSKRAKRKIKKFLTSQEQSDIIIKLLIRSGSQKRSLTTEQ